MELTRVYHNARSNPQHKSGCAINQTWDCDKVARSKYSSFLGAPVSMWGMLGYAAIGLFATLALFGVGRDGWALGLLALNVVGAAAVAGYMAYSSHVLGVKCPYCYGLYGIGGLLVILQIPIFITEGRNPLRAIADDFGLLFDRLALLGGVAAAGVAGLLVVLLVGPQLGKPKKRPPKKIDMGSLIKRPTMEHPSMRPRMVAGPDAGAHPTPPKPRQPKPPADLARFIGKTTPWKGAEKPDLYLVEWADYQCPGCLYAHLELKKVLAKHGQRVRLYFRHFPLDQRCLPKLQRQMHPEACRAAEVAICAHDQNKFWPMHEAIWGLKNHFSGKQLMDAAKQVGLDMAKLRRCIRSPRTARLVREDIRAGELGKLQATPHMIVGGPYTKTIDSNKFEVSAAFFDKLLTTVDKAKGPAQKPPGPGPMALPTPGTKPATKDAQTKK